jgi:hypothetical protein
MLVIFIVVLEMSRIVIRLAMCMRTMAKRNCGWQNNYNDEVKVGTSIGNM